MSTDTAGRTDAPPPRVRQLFRRLGWAIAASPAALLVIQLLHALHLRLLLGRWPRVYRDNPDTYLFRIHDAALLAFFIAALSGVTLWAALSLVVALLLPSARGTILKQGGLVALGVLLLVLFWTLDPTGYIEWLED